MTRGAADRHLIGTPVPQSRYSQSEDDASPGEVGVVDGTHHPHRVVWWDAAALVRVDGESGGGNGAQKLVGDVIVTADLVKTY